MTPEERAAIRAAHCSRIKWCSPTEPGGDMRPAEVCVLDRQEMPCSAIRALDWGEQMERQNAEYYARLARAAPDLIALEHEASGLRCELEDAQEEVARLREAAQALVDIFRGQGDRLDEYAAIRALEHALAAPAEPEP